MKTLVLGDIHGRTVWQDIIAIENPDHVVFIGDYFDSKEDISGLKQIENFHKIVSYKESNPYQITLLAGNHDLHYIINEQYSGFQYHYRKDISEIIHMALQKDFLQLCFILNSFLFSHAGFTKTWCKQVLKNEAPQGLEFAQLVNNLLKSEPATFRFTMGQNLDFSGDDVTQPPTWVRPASLLQDRLNGYIQIVGHTTQSQLLITDEVVFLDTLGTSGEYLIIENGKLTPKKQTPP